MGDHGNLAKSKISSVPRRKECKRPRPARTLKLGFKRIEISHLTPRGHSGTPLPCFAATVLRPLALHRHEILILARSKCLPCCPLWVSWPAPLYDGALYYVNDSTSTYCMLWATVFSAAANEIEVRFRHCETDTACLKRMCQLYLSVLTSACYGAKLRYVGTFGVDAEFLVTDCCRCVTS